MSLSPGSKNKLYYGYIIAAAAGVLQIIMWGLLNTYGVFFIPMHDEFGWSRAAISGARSFSMLVWGFISIILGSLNDRYGPRVIMAVCGCFLGAGYFLMSQVSTLWQLYMFYGIIIGIGVSATDVVVLSTVARWFKKKLGMMTGIVKVGTGLGMFIMPLAADGLISSYGWRDTYMILGIMGAIFVVSVSQLLRKEPGNIQQRPSIAKRDTPSNIHASQSGSSFHDATRTTRLWLTSIMYLTLWFCVNIVLVHLAPHAMDMGISSAKAAGILSSIGAISILGRLVIGFSSDRIGCRKSMIVCCTIFVISFSVLLMAREFWMLILFAIIYGFAHGGYATLISPMVAELFGMRSHGAILGIIIFLGTIGGAIGPVFAGYLFDTTGSYQSSFFVCIAMGVIGLILSTTLKPVTAKSL
ncbi:MAG: MFS transporter [Dehalococcoidia bacterium]|nr:MFS transporter [Dehalococcoidia bacterium]